MSYSNLSPVTVSNETENTLLGSVFGTDFEGSKSWSVNDGEVGYFGGGYISGTCTQNVTRTVRIKLGSVVMAEIVFPCADGGEFEITWRIKCNLVSGGVFTLQLFYSGWTTGDVERIKGRGDEHEITSHLSEGIRFLPAFDITGQNSDEGDITVELLLIN